MTTGEKKPCLHPRAQHRHGTHLAYGKDGCRCAPCVLAYRRQAKATTYRTATGTHSYVPADRARDHVCQLLEVLTVGQVEQRSGLHRTAIRTLVGDFPGRPQSRRVTRATEAALLAVTHDVVGPEQHGLVDGTGTRRRVRALVALGWPARPLGRRLGWSTATVQAMTSLAVPESTPVLVATRDAVRKLYDELGLTIPPAGRARTRARGLAVERGWASPLAWDDDTIDDPAATPLGVGNDVDAVDQHAIDTVRDGHTMRLTGVTLHAAVHEMTAAGYSIDTIAARTGADERQISRLRARANPPRAKAPTTTRRAA